MTLIGRRLVSLVMSLGLLVASCGGDDDSAATSEASIPRSTVATPPATEAPAAATEAPATAPAEPQQPEDQPSGAGSSANQAVVSIDGADYQFDVEMSIVGRCEADFFGAFWVIAGAADGSSGSLEMFIVPDGNTNHDETSRIAVNLKDAEGRDWNADEDGGGGVAAGDSRVDSVTIDGKTVTGTASFVDIYAGDGATARGTFAATCP
jgi:hypothetical protein